MCEPFDFAAVLDDQIVFPAYTRSRWATRKEWYDHMYEQGYHWISDYYDENGILRTRPESEK